MWERSNRLSWFLVILLFGLAVVALLAWVGQWPIPDLFQLKWAQTDDQLAWNTACDAVRARVKYPSEAVFPEMPEVEVTHPNTISLKYHVYGYKTAEAQLFKAQGEIEKYYKWRQEILDRVEMTKEEDYWIISGWTDSPTPMGVLKRIPWFAKYNIS